MTAEGAAQIELRMQAEGALAAEARQRYHAKGTRNERLSQDFASDFPGFELASGPQAVEVNDLEDIEEPVKLHVKGRVAGFARHEGADLSLSVAPTGRLVPSLASLSARSQPIRLRLRSSIDDEFAIQLPPGYRVKTAPEPVDGSTPFGRFSVRSEVTGNKVVVKTQLSLDKRRISPAEYADWRAFCETVDRAFAQRLVIGAAK